MTEKDALSQFSESEIDDTDGDGCKEFVDGWGQPIFFLRWAPGFDSDLQKHQTETIDGKSVAMPHDPFDPLNVQLNAFALYPLIYSGGPDKIRGIKNANTAAPLRTISDPYADNNGAAVDTSGSNFDNITNHDLFGY
ncbi:MAG: hypothetical protein QM811_12740 [Pirellulales bacterium]